MYTSSDIVVEIFLNQFDLNKYSSSLSKYVKICEFIKEKIESEVIPNQTQLPSTRVLAKKINVSRSTINQAYELLILEGFIEAKRGSGYWVIDRSDIKSERPENEHSNYPEISEKGKAFFKNVNLIHSTNEKFIAFRPGLPPLDIFPVNQWKKLTNLYWRNIKSSSLSFTDSSGVDHLKKNIAYYLKLIRGIQCSHEQIIIVSGSLQSLYLIGNSLINNGDRMVMENPTFPNVHSIFRSLQANIDAVPIDDEGIRVDQIKTDQKPKLIHITPSNHYPYGVKMSKKRKLDLLKYASKNESIIIENDYDHEISNWKSKDPSLFNLDQEQRTVFLGTFNRLLHQSVRLGYMVVPHYLLETIKALQKHSHRFVSPSNQVVMSRFIEKNHLFHHKSILQKLNSHNRLFLKCINNSLFGSDEHQYQINQLLQLQKVFLCQVLPDHEFFCL